MSSNCEHPHYLDHHSEHNSGHNHGHHHHSSVNNIGLAFGLNLTFAFIELIGGFFTNSVSILADALHDFSDSLVLGLSWYLQKVSLKKRDTSFSYGYRRFSLLGALISAIVLICGSVFILFKTVPRLFTPEEVNAPGMLGLAFLGIAVNGFSYFRLHKGDSLNEKVVSLHLLEDLLGWVAVLFVSILIYFFHWYILDPVLSVMITIFIFVNVFRNLSSVVKVFLQAVPDGINIQELEKTLLSKLPILSVHDFHLWSLDGSFNVLSFHIVVDKNTSNSEIIDLKSQIRELVLPFNVHHSTIEIEFPDEKCELESC
ncbi:MAG: cation diffusion facilitator family transporter [Candidatus Caenarcaniphilales bacterium]|nr:cation diffusion facilitator family transporter [Candidatus Caenarcaniphilales bacterium]